tara:strand:+ start:26 stop:532 length:507 start_codon:yes stop_codon:yes gene_type:complete
MKKKGNFKNFPNIQNILIIILVILVLYLLVKLFNVYSNNNSGALVEGFYSSSKSKKMIERFKKIKRRNKDNFKNTKDKQLKEEFDSDKIQSFSDSLRKSNLVSTKNRKKMGNPIIEKVRSGMEDYSNILNKGILSKRSRNLEDSFKKFDKLKERFWDIFDKKKRRKKI